MVEWGVERPVPRLLASLLCEDAASSIGLGDRRVTLQRVFFVLYADAFPAGYDRLVVANFWYGSEGTYQEGVQIVAPDGTAVAQGESELAVPEAPVVMTQLSFFPNLVLPEAGDYTVQVLIDDAAVHTHTLRVVEVERSEDDGA